MRSGGAKQKGSSFERTVCRELSLWVTQGQRDDVFWRSATSGGRATIGLSRGIIRHSQAGDISPIAAVGEALLNHVVIECKHYKELNLFAGITNDTGNLYKFWNNLIEHSFKFSRQPMLIAKQNNMPTVVLLKSSTSFLLFGLDADHVTAVLPRWDCHIILFDCFLREAEVPLAAVRIIGRQRAML